jgi:dTDP-4-dehydrorhamnose 3,5-epimerase
MPFNIIDTNLTEVKILQPKVFGDARGFFYESFNARDFLSAVGVDTPFVQDNHSKSSLGVLRGLHYQIKHPQGKLVRVISGEVYDVVVDIRRSSPSFGRWMGARLSAENNLQIWIPPGFAHGFMVLSESAEFLYKTTDYWYPEHERSLIWNEPTLGIDWPQGVTPLLSNKDLNAPNLKQAELFD